MQGREYYYVTAEEFEREVQNNAFLETAVFSMNRYGTSRKAVSDVISKGLVCILDIDLQGVLSMKKQGFEALYVLICPPSMEELETRLRRRGDTSEEQIRSRLKIAQNELEHRNRADLWDIVVVNDVPETCVASILNALDEKSHNSKI